MIADRETIAYRRALRAVACVLRQRRHCWGPADTSRALDLIDRVLNHDHGFLPENFHRWIDHDHARECTVCGEVRL